MDLSTTSTRLFHFISGSFRSLALFLLAFDPAQRTIHHVQTISTLGPHQYLATNQHKDRIFSTTWAQPPSLQSWILQRSTSEPWRLSQLGTAPITATSSYIDIPPPFTHIYSVGGPTGEIHFVNESTGSFGNKVQEILFVSGAELPQADKTRVALRYGSHGIESTSSPSYSLTFVPVLGTDSIEAYSRDVASGLLTHVHSSPSPRGPGARDGPRHVKIHPNGKILYCVTEHSNFVDLYDIISPPDTSSVPFLKHVQSRSLVPDHLRSNLHQYRGDTLLLTPPTTSHPSPYALFTTTRGSTTSTRGWLSIFALNKDGYFLDEGQTDTTGHAIETVVRHETGSSGGKANAIDLLTIREVPPLLPQAIRTLKDDDDDADGDPRHGYEVGGDSGTLPHKQAYLHSHFKANESETAASYENRAWKEADQGVWILLTDDDETTAAGNDMTSASGSVQILEWGGWGKEGVRVVAEWPTPPVEGGDLSQRSEAENMMGGSHAIWLV